MVADVAPPATSVHRLGRGLSQRARSQSVLVRRRTSSRLIGAVGKASIGFGLAVGRSRSIRPVVRRSDLNTSMLRPPPGFWHERISDEIDDPFEAASFARAPQVASETAGHRAPQRVSSADRRQVAPVTRREPARTEPVRRSAATSWTDQIIERSAVGYTRPTSGATITPAGDFVSSGDAKLDQLRLMMGAGEVPEPEPVAEPASKSEPSSAAHGHARRGDTAAGAGTGPGRLGRAMQPESALPGTPLTSTKGGGSSQAQRVAAPGVPATPGAGSAGPHRRRAGQPGPQQRLDDLKAALLSKGLIPGSEGSNDEAPRSDPDIRRQASDRRPSGRSGPDGSSKPGDGSHRRRPDPQSSDTGDRRANSSADSTTERLRQAGRAVTQSDTRRAVSDRPGDVSTGSTSPTATRGGAPGEAVASDSAHRASASATDPTSVSETRGSAGAISPTEMSAEVTRSAIGLLERTSSPATIADSAGDIVQRRSDALLPIRLPGRDAVSAARRFRTRDAFGRLTDPAAARSATSSQPDEHGTEERSTPIVEAVPHRVTSTAASKLLGMTPRLPGPRGRERPLRRATLPRVMSSRHRPVMTELGVVVPGGPVMRRVAEHVRPRPNSSPDHFGTTRPTPTISRGAEPSTGRATVAEQAVAGRATAATTPSRPPVDRTTIGRVAADDVESSPPSTTAQPSTGTGGTGDMGDVGADGDASRRTATAARDASMQQSATSVPRTSWVDGSESVDRDDATDEQRSVYPISPVDGATVSPPAAGVIRRESAASDPFVQNSPDGRRRSDRRWAASTESTISPMSSNPSGLTSTVESSSSAAPLPQSAHEPSTVGAAQPSGRRPWRAASTSILPAGPGALVGALRRSFEESPSQPAVRAPRTRSNAIPRSTSTSDVPTDASSIGQHPAEADADGSTVQRPRDRAERAAAPSVERMVDTSELPTAPPLQSPATETTTPATGLSSIDRAASSATRNRRQTSESPRTASSSESPRAVPSSESSSISARGSADTRPLATDGSTASSIVRRQIEDAPSPKVAAPHEFATASEPTLDRRRDAAAGPPVNELADRFMTELSRTIRRRPAPLPVSFQPMADAITGGRRVMLSTDNASRHALRRVGKVAATTDDVIHLAEAPTPGARLNEVIAHELTHIANPSPVARFFDDGDDSPEERRADRVARVMAKSPMAPNASTVPPVLPGMAAASGGRTSRDSAGRPSLIRRSPAASGTPTFSSSAATPGGTSAMSSSSMTSSGGVSASALAASITGKAGPASGSASGPSDSIQRLAGSPKPAEAPPVPSRENRPALSVGSQLHNSPEARAWFAEQLERNFDSLVNALEDRMIVEFERRGGRHWENL